MKSIVVFLDFDGVLHYFFPKEDASDEDNAFFAFLPNFEDAIRLLKNEIDFKIVISSSWREMKTLKDIKSNFSNDIAELIIDVTPVLNKDIDFVREKEAMLWLQNSTTKNWIAVDDYKDIWENHDHLVHCIDGFMDKEKNIFIDLCKSFAH